jgi:RNA ligase (TIGR02306 family)
MSTVKIKAVTIEDIRPHPNADRLDVVLIGGYKVCVPKNKYSVGDVVAYFPPDILIPNKLATELGVATYLREARYPGEVGGKTKCRVGALRLRGVPSFGFILKTDSPIGTDLTDSFQGKKFEPTDPYWYRYGVHAPSNPKFHKYTDIENWRNFRYVMRDNTPVRITEKIHGTNSRIGLIDGKYLCGSHSANLKQKDRKSRESVYWRPLTTDLKNMLACISEGAKDVIVFGEIYGSSIQFMDYGIIGDTGYRVFDISVNGEYLPWNFIEYYCKRFCIPLVPLLYEGPYSEEIVTQLVDGNTKVVDEKYINCDFKGREGVVITPLNETYSAILDGRLILKAVSVDYLSVSTTDSH